MKKYLIVAFFAVLIFLATRSWAAHTSEPIAGVVTAIYGDSIAVEVRPSVLEALDVNGVSKGIFTFKINSDIGYRNINKLTDLKKGDPIEIEYNEDVTTNSRVFIATYITRLNSAITAASTIETTTITR